MILGPGISGWAISPSDEAPAFLTGKAELFAHPFCDCSQDPELLPTQGTDPPQTKLPELYLLDLWNISLLGIALLSFTRKPEGKILREGKDEFATATKWVSPL